MTAEAVRTTLLRAYRGAAGLILLFGAAQLALWAGRVSPAVFPLPSAVVGSAADLVRNVDQLAKDTLRSFGFGPLAVAGRVSLPSAAPFAATGVRIAASFAFVVAVAVELAGAGMNGIGAFTSQAESGTGDMAILIAVAVWAGLIGLAINAVFNAAERWAFRWHYALTGTGGAQR